MNINENYLAQSLKHINLEPWHDGRSILDGKRPIEQHIMMVINSLKAERDSLIEKRLKAQGQNQEKELPAMTTDEIRLRLSQLLNFQIEVLQQVHAISPLGQAVYKTQCDIMGRMLDLEKIIIGKA